MVWVASRFGYFRTELPPIRLRRQAKATPERLKESPAKFASLTDL
jgi:hypothetical protein